MSADIHDTTQDKSGIAVPLWKDTSTEDHKRFEISETGERIPVTRLDSWRDFALLLESDFFNSPNTQLVFRGHRRCDWSLTPTLGRLATNGIVTDRLAKEHLQRFKQAVRGRLNDPALVHEDDELWSIGQHHGLMTPLLDWTYAPYVALFFAFHKDDGGDNLTNEYRSVYVLNKSFLVEHESKTGIRVLEPRKDYHGRLVNQAGLFTFTSGDATLENKLIDFLSGEHSPDAALANAVQKTEENQFAIDEDEDEAEILARYICKIYIRNEERDACLRHLRRMNVHHASLFPDLLGASDYCNILTTEAELETKREEQTEKNNNPTINFPVEESENLEINLPALVTDPIIQNDIEDILYQYLNGDVLESDLVSKMAEEINFSIAKNQIVDWETSEVVQARMRNTIRVILRKYGYPRQPRDQVAEQIIILSKPKKSSDR